MKCGTLILWGSKVRLQVIVSHSVMTLILLRILCGSVVMISGFVTEWVYGGALKNGEPGRFLMYPRRKAFQSGLKRGIGQLGRI